MCTIAISMASSYLHYSIICWHLKKKKKSSLAVSQNLRWHLLIACFVWATVQRSQRSSICKDIKKTKAGHPHIWEPRAMSVSRSPAMVQCEISPWILDESGWIIMTLLILSFLLLLQADQNFSLSNTFLYSQIPVKIKPVPSASAVLLFSVNYHY